MLKGKTVLVTGGAGSVGSEVVKRLLKQKPAQLRIYSRDEGKHHAFLEELGRPKNVRMLVGDIRDKDRLSLAFRGVDVVYHAAALKHVPLCEYNPFEAVRTNIVGSQNIIDVAVEQGVDRVIAVSTDKVIDPVSVMGTSKLMMEKLMINANYYNGGAPTTFACVRFGNVAWARGSVLPLWKKQAELNGEITVTNGDMTRFMMSIPDAANLVVKAGELAKGGEIFVLKMPSISIDDLATEFISKYYPDKKIKIKYVGSRAGEKLHEGLLGPGDGDVLESKEMYISVPNIWDHTGAPAKKRTYKGFKKAKGVHEYTSADKVDIKGIRKVI